ncbi:ABC transporter permease [Paludibacterium paludis]|uniref:Permease n=1 Tax=Paludibacterium paludis TaxID=1225769 RepID=A0A918P2J3_9NEIS|nr:FtsX-like permease family protein [Paludibacterium paludis]GGY14697.1 permease [Paludibacterium paludis]
MVSIARSSLIYEWRRFLPATLAVAFAGLLVQIQMSLLLGMFSSVAVYIDRSGADLWAGYPGTQSVDLARPISTKVENSLRMHPEVTRVERLTWTGGDWLRPTGGKLIAVLIGISPSPDSMTFSNLLTPRLRQLLDEPNSILVDIADLDKLGVRVGDTTELMGKRVKVVGTVNGMRSMGSANVLASLATARKLDPSLRKDNTEYFLIKLKNPENAEAVRDLLQPKGSFKPFQVWTSEEFSTQSQGYWLFESGAGSGFLFSSTLGLLVGIVITSQTLMGAIVAALREYATLRALGVSTSSLRGVVLEQSFWVGVVGLLITAVVGSILIMVAKAAYIPLETPLAGCIATGILVLGIAMLSGLAALRALNQAEPFTLLR